MKSGIDENDMTVLVQEDVETDICLGTAKRLLPPPTTTTTTTTSPDSTLTLRNISLDRQSDLRRSWPLILAFLGTEMVKQLSNYAATQNNDDVSPMPPVLLVLLTELTKLVLVLCWAVVSGRGEFTAVVCGVMSVSVSDCSENGYRKRLRRMDAASVMSEGVGRVVACRC
ncbi:hypothetical protein E2C01_026559 [Portunus trituberculatus]|uniref:Uncharacterized protein n=1 Tax=Portunus trituberculatus TaxID=210409 RepID=A0A5B7EJ40_PORTR|nr:hypothetical protein [Portunus trituberculatus]